jgi:two-component system NarL family sensor kinase
LNGASDTGFDDGVRQVLRSFLDVVADETDISRILTAALEDCCELLGLKTGWIYLLDEATAEPSLAASRCMPNTFSSQPERWEGICGCVHALYQHDETPFPALPQTDRCSRLQGVADDNEGGLRYHVCIPLFLRQKPIGIINVARADWQPVSMPLSRALLELGRLLSLAVERARLADTTPVLKAERERIARELHDTLLQGLTGIALQLETADALMQPGSGSRSPLRRALELTQETMAETRAAIDGLGAVALRSETLASVLTRLVAEFAEENAVEAVAEVKLEGPRLPLQIETAIVRIVREGLQNVVRHAGATHVHLGARRSKGRLSLILADDGRGFDASKVAASYHGYGIASMRRRTQLVGGRFRLVTAPGGGTRVEISIPAEYR